MGGNIRTNRSVGRPARDFLLTVTAVFVAALPLLPNVQDASAASGNANLHLDKTVATASLAPNLSIALAVDKSNAIPRDVLTYSTTVTNTGATLTVAGDLTAQATPAQAATVSSYFDDVSTASNAHCGADGTNHGHDTSQWTPLAGKAATKPGYTPTTPAPMSSGMILSVTPVPSNGVTYPRNGDLILGTQLAPGATATWHYVSTMTLTPSQVSFLLDPARVTRIRNTFHAEVGPPQGVGQPPTVDVDFCQQLFGSTPSASGAATNLTVTITPQTASPVQFTPSTTPALASLPSGASVTVSAGYRVPPARARHSDEQDTDYLARLHSLDGSPVQATATATGVGSAGPVSAGPVSSPVTTEHLPVLGITKSGPAKADAGTTQQYPLALSNSGSATATTLGVADQLPNGSTGTVSGVPTQLAPGTTGSASAAYAIPADQPDGPLTDAAVLSWQDANQDAYGPISSAFSTQVASSFVGAHLVLTPATAGPDVTGTVQILTATFTDRSNNPVVNRPITFAVAGPNATSGSATTDQNGDAVFSYSGASDGTDAVQATFTAGGLTLQSNTATVGWVTPVATVATTSVLGRFFGGGCGDFCHSPSDTPAFSQTFPTINFNTPGGTVPGNNTGVSVSTRPFTDVTTDVGGNFTGTVVAQGNGAQAGLGNLFSFDAVFTANYIVANAGDITFNFYSDDGFIFGVGNGATRVSGASRNPPGNGLTPFQAYPVMGDYNGPTSPVANSITVHFPAPGVYPYEVDYDECCGGEIALTMTTSSAGHGVVPAGDLTLTPQNVPVQPVGQPVRLTVAAMDAGGVAIANLPVVATVTGPNAQPVTGTTDAHGLAVLSYVGTAEGTDEVEVGANVSGMPAISNLTLVPWAYTVPGSSGGSSTDPPPAITAPSPADGSVVSQPTPIAATFTPPTGQTIASWKVTDQAAEGGPTVTLASGAGQPPTPLATFDPTQLANDIYKLDLVAVASGGGSQDLQLTLPVVGALKLGRYVTTYQDLSVPIGGFQMQVQRTYDSIDTARVGDFGYGWHVGLANFRVTENRALGAGGWTEYPTSCFILCNYAYHSSLAHFVTVTFPDGHSEIFDLAPTAPPYSLVDFATGTGVFIGRSINGNGDTLVPLDETSFSYDYQGNLLANGGYYDPQQYQLTLANGTKLVLSTSAGLISETDPNGTRLSVDAGGVHDSNGQSIGFTRDGLGRITQITGPSGQTLQYNYSSAGDLAGFTDPDGRVITYTYDTSHRLLTIAGKGLPPQRTLHYDAGGRLTGFTDGAGNTYALSNDVGARQQTVTDPTGKETTILTLDALGDVVKKDDLADGQDLVTSYTYDAVGHQVSATDPAGHTFAASYDGGGNLLTYTDADGRTLSLTYGAAGNPVSSTDPLGRTTTFTYDSQLNLTSIVDPLGKATHFDYNARGQETVDHNSLGGSTTIAYDSLGRETGETDPLGNTTAYGYDTSNRLTSVTDALGHVAHGRYDSDGHLLTATDALGHTTTFAYDPLGRLVSQSDPMGHTTAYSYDNAGRLVSVTDPLGHSTTYAYDADGRVIKQTDPAGAITAYAYDGHGRLASTTDPLGNVTSETYDAAGHVVSEKGPNGGIASFTYDGDGRTLSRTDPLGGTTSFIYDGAGHLVKQTDPTGAVTSFTYDVAGNQVSRTDPLGHTSTTAYDAAGDVVKTTDPLGNATTNAYNARGELSTTTDATGRTTALGYDGVGNLVSVTDPAGHVSQMSYDAAGRLTGSTTPSGVVTSFTYDASGRRLTTADALGDTTTNVYDAAGRLVKQTDPNGHATSFGYDASGRVLSLTDALGGTASSSYDAAGNLLTSTDPDGHATKLTYDALGDITSRTDPAGGTVSSVYDLAGRLTRQTNARGQLAVSGYNARGDLTSIQHPGGTDTFGYDAAGRQTTLTDTHGTTTLAYDAASRLTSAISPEGTVGYGYDAAGRRSALTLASGTVGYSYDAAGLLSKVVEPGGATTSVAHNADGQLATVARANGVSTGYTYDAAGRLTGIADTGPGGAIDHFGYALDAAGNRVAANSTAGAETYSLDADNRLVKVTYPDGSHDSYTYDAAGNRLTDTSGTGATAYTYNSAGQLVSAGSTVYGYDADGSQTTAGSSSFGYDWANRLTSATVGGAGSSFTYDASGLRVTATGATAGQYLWDRGLPVPQILGDGANQYARTDQGALLSQHGASGTTYPLADAPGSVRDTTSASGAVVGQTSYSAFGAVRSHTGTSSIFGFAGEQVDPTGLQYLRARYYDPTTGRFTSPDSQLSGGPGTQGLNAYLYAVDNPTTMTDPTGHEAMVEFGTNLASKAGQLGRLALLGGITGAGFGAVFGAIACPHNQSFGGCMFRSAFGGFLAGMITGLLPGGTTAAAFISGCAAGGGSDVIGQLLLTDTFSVGEAVTNTVVGCLTGVVGYKAATSIGPRIGAFVAENALTKNVLGLVQGLLRRLLPDSGKVVATDATAGAVDHIALGIDNGGQLDAFANQVGARTLMQDPAWRQTLMDSIGNPNTKFSVNLDGLSGDSVYAKVMNAAQRGAADPNQLTNWELSQLYQGGRLGNTDFYEGGQLVANPFGG